MSKKLRYLLFVLVLMIPLVLAACGGDDDDGDNGGGSGDSVSLNQTFESETGVSFKYPDGWAAQDDEGQIILSNSPEGLEAMTALESGEGPGEGQVGMMVMALPLADLGMPEDTTVDTIFDMMTGSMTSEGMETVGDTEELKIGDNDARKVNVKDAESGSDGFIIAFLDENDTYMMLIGVTASGERDNYDDVALDIAETIEYTAPAAE